MSEELVEEYLAHYGRLGMKWGVVTEKKQTKRDNKAAEYTAKAKGYQKEIDKLNSQRGRNADAPWLKKQKLNELKTAKKTALEDAEAKRQGKMTEKQKNIAKGVGISVAVLAAYGTYSMAQSGQLHSAAERGKAFMRGNEKVRWAKNSNLAQSGLTAEELASKVVKPINAGFGAFGTKMNCRRCTYAYEMRRRGFDVTATRTSNARGQDASGLFNVLNPDTKNFVHPGRGGMFARVVREGLSSKGSSKPKPFTRTLTSNLGKYGGERPVVTNAIFRGLETTQPDGARGELTMRWLGGGAHSVAWEMIKGKAVVFDTQSGKMFKDEFELHNSLPMMSSAAITRLDNMNLNDNFLLRWLK